MPEENDYVEFYVDAKEEFRWRYKAGNHEVMADSAEGYKDVRECQTAAQRVTARFIAFGSQATMAAGANVIDGRWAD